MSLGIVATGESVVVRRFGFGAPGPRTGRLWTGSSTGSPQLARRSILLVLFGLKEMSPMSGANVSPAARGGVGKLGNSGGSSGCCTAYTSSSSTGGVIDQYLPAAASSALKLLRPKSESANSPISLGLQVEAMLI